MDIRLANDIIKMMPDERTVFRYHQDRYAFMLLEYAIKGDTTIAQIKRSQYAKLLDRPAIKKVMAQNGHGKLVLPTFDVDWLVDVQNYVLTLGLWGWRKPKMRSWFQTSRAGTNLVLQLNFDRKHDTAHGKLLQNYQNADFGYKGHPINKTGRTTLSWARIDLDLDSGEALIEELQNDWIRNAYDELEFLKKTSKPDTKIRQNMSRYVGEYLDPHVKNWSQTILSAVLFFLIEEIGIRKIWLHDFDTGNRLKRLKYSKPPRSLYTRLPKQFCFEKVKHAPSFLYSGVSKQMRKRFESGQERFWKLEI